VERRASWFAKSYYKAKPTVRISDIFGYNALGHSADPADLLLISYVCYQSYLAVPDEFHQESENVCQGRSSIIGEVS